MCPGAGRIHLVPDTQLDSSSQLFRDTRPCDRALANGAQVDVIGTFQADPETSHIGLSIIICHIPIQCRGRQVLKEGSTKKTKFGGWFVATANVSLIHQAAKIKFPTSLSAKGGP